MLWNLKESGSVILPFYLLSPLHKNATRKFGVLDWTTWCNRISVDISDHNPEAKYIVARTFCPLTYVGSGNKFNCMYMCTVTHCLILILVIFLVTVFKPCRWMSSRNWREIQHMEKTHTWWYICLMFLYQVLIPIFLLLSSYIVHSWQYLNGGWTNAEFLE